MIYQKDMFPAFPTLEFYYVVDISMDNCSKMDAEIALHKNI